MTAAAKTTGRRLGLDSARISEEAKKLSAERGFDGWSIRDLANRLDAAPSVIYHYFPNRSALASSVLELIGRDVAPPDDSLDWKDWFLQTATSLRSTLLLYNGAADRLLLNLFPSSLVPLLDKAFAKLYEAGFGSKAPFAYSMIFNVALGAIAGRDHRSAHERSSTVDLDETMARIERMEVESEGLSILVEEFLKPLARQDANPGNNEISDEYFELLMRSILCGIEQTLK